MVQSLPDGVTNPIAFTGPEARMQRRFDSFLEDLYPEVHRISYMICNNMPRPVDYIDKILSMGIRAGMPDYCIPIARGKYHAFYIEFKSGDAPLGEDQARVIPDLREQGNCVVVCRSYEAAVDAFLKYMNQGNEDVQCGTVTVTHSSPDFKHTIPLVHGVGGINPGDLCA